MRRPTDPDRLTLTDADRTSQTRFGPRPVPAGHKTAPRRTLSTSGTRAGHPSTQISTTAKVVVWAGIAVGIAGLTAATSAIAQKLVGSDSDDRPHYRATPVAPRFAHLDEDEREAMRRRVRAQAREDSQNAARLRAKASRGRGNRGNVAKNLTRTATDLSQGLNGVAQSLSGAFAAFRGVSGQATSIVGEFVAAADQLRAILNGQPGPQPGTGRDTAGRDNGARAARDNARI